MGFARLRARSLGLVLVLFGGTAQAAEVMHMPYACRFDGVRVHLRPSEERTYAIIGGHEREIFTACSPTDPGTCRNWFVHRFDFDCDGARVAWIDAAAAAARHTDWDAWNAGGHFRMRMNELWGVAHARPLGPRRRWMRRQMREEAFAEETGPGHTVTLPPGFAPAVGIPLTFSGGAPEVAEQPPSGAPAVAAYTASKPQRSPAPDLPERAPPKGQQPAEAWAPPVVAPAPQATTTPPADVATPPAAPPAPSAPATAEAKAPPPASAGVPAGSAATEPGSVTLLNGPRAASPKAPAPITPQSDTAAARIETSAVQAPARIGGQSTSPPVSGETTIAQTSPPPAPAPSVAPVSEPPPAAAEPPAGMAMPHLTSGPVLAAMAATALALTGLALLGFGHWRRRAPALPPVERDIADISFGGAPGGPMLALERAPSPAPSEAPAMPEQDGAAGAADLAVPTTYDEALEVLGASPEASTSAIKKIVDGLRQSWHPDHARSEADRLHREARMCQINVAWDLVSQQRSAA